MLERKVEKQWLVSEPVLFLFLGVKQAASWSKRECIAGTKSVRQWFWGREAP